MSNFDVLLTPEKVLRKEKEEKTLKFEMMRRKRKEKKEKKGGKECRDKFEKKIVPSWCHNVEYHYTSLWERE